jgi:hypothetical protein
VEQHEEAFVNAFILREKRPRYRQFLASGKRRPEVLDRLNHGPDIDWTTAAVVPPDQRSAAAVETLLRQRGAGATCHVIADGLELDGRQAPLGQALAVAVDHQWAVVLSCVPGHLAFYKEEAPGNWWLLEREKGR